ncbi:MFS transporter [Bizionia saleffrena]|uniref:ADP,ATP carrier protein n=1 Tax=Bizionia saleffrena TaxID=291189 RepID=A0A8H2LNC8_9FLAO|nr:Npt1/Npt2 family nucleotide transporter [Bizionia saleffrena]TYB76714.1 MFS transporter [Bizionia saleffrena]
MFKQLINKTFGLRDGEIYISFLMQLYVFLIITVLLIVKPTVNALFLSRLGAEHLPYGYLLVAGVAVATSYFYNKALRKFSILNVTIISLISFSVSFLLLSLFLQFSLLNSALLYVYYLGVSLFAVIATSQFWILANMVYNAREAKRLFGFIGAGAIAGGIFGGYLTSIIVSSFGNKIVVLLAGVLILFCIPILKKIWKLRIRKMNIYVRKQRKVDKTMLEDSSIILISKSKHLTYLALITGIGVIIAKLVDFQFSDFAYKAISDPDELATFFGFWFSTFNVIALVIQLFLTNRVLSKLGVSSTLLILPLGIALGCLLFLTFPELWVLIIIKGIDGSFKQSLNKAAVELSVLPIPLLIKNQAKSFIDVVVDSIATGVSGLMLLFLIRRLDLNSSYITVIVLLFVFVWIILIYRLREAYYESFRENIQRNLSQESNDKKMQKGDTTLSVALDILNNGSEEDISSLLKHLSSYKLKSLKSNVIHLLEHSSTAIKMEAIKHLYDYDKGTALNKVQQLVYIKDDALVLTALEYILNHSSFTEEHFFNKYLNNGSDYIASAALLCLAKEASNNQHLANKYQLESRIQYRVRLLNSPEGFSRKEAVGELLITIAYSGLQKYYPFISVHLNNRDPFIVARAIEAAGITSNQKYIDTLLEFIDDVEQRKNAIKALIEFGPKIIDTILELEQNETLKDNIKQHLPRVIEAFKTQDAVKVLFRLMRSRDIVIRLEASKSLIKLKNKNSKLYFNKRQLKSLIIKESKYYKSTLNAMISVRYTIDESSKTLDFSDKGTEILLARQSIEALLKQQQQHSLKCIFKLLSLAYYEDDIEVTYSGLLSNVKEARVNALEFLDNLIQSDLKRKLFPLIEHFVIDEAAFDASVLNLKRIPEKTYINRLLKSRGKKMKLEILNLIKQLEDVSYLPVILPYKKHRNEEVKFFAYDTIQSLENTRN